MKTNYFWILKEKKEDSYIDAIDSKTQRKRNSQESNKKKNLEW